MKLGASTMCFMDVPTTQARTKRKPAQLASSDIPIKISKMKMAAITICFTGIPTTSQANKKEPAKYASLGIPRKTNT